MATGDFLLRRLPPEDVKLRDEEARRFYILKIKIMQNFFLLSITGDVQSIKVAMKKLLTMSF